MKEINFEVVEIKMSDVKVGYADVTLRYNDGDTFEFLRRANKESGTNYSFVIIEGVKILFKGNEVISLQRVYETTHRKKSTFTVGKKKDVKVPEVQKEEEVKVVIDDEDDKEDNNLTTEVKHEKYEVIKACLLSDIPVYLAGPAGSGKNHTVEQIAKELGWNFYFTNSVQQEYKLTGFIDAGGKFHETEFYKACNDDNDCVFFLDEMDASIPEVLVLLNAAIANGYFEFPNGRVDLKNVHFVSAGNTVGSGADEMYTGRMVLDQATLDRFAIIEFDYDKKIELAISGGNKELVDFIHSLRKFANENGIRATFSYRCITMVTKLEKTNLSLEMIIKISVLKGLDKDTINSFIVWGPSKYGSALTNIQKGA